MTKVLFLTVRADFGGGPEHLWQLLQHFPTEIEAYVACPEDYPYYARFCECVGEEKIFLLPHRRFSLKKLWELRLFCRKHGIAVLHSHGKGAGAYSRLLGLMTGLPCVHTFHGVHMQEYGSVKKQLYRMYERGMGLLTKTGIAVSQGELESIVQEGLIPASKLRLIPNGVRVPPLPARLLDDVRTGGAPYSVVSITRFDYAKNSTFLADILQALKKRNRLSDFSLVVIGDGPDRAELQERAETQGLSGLLHCVGTSPEPAAYFDQALCCLSTSRWEGLPLAVLEAQAHGLPAVLSDVVGNRDAVVRDITGILYPAGDADAAADALIRLADDPLLRKNMGEAGEKHILQNHNVRTMAAYTSDILRGLGQK